MAKVTVTFEDNPLLDGGFSMVIDLDPPIKNIDEATAAQLAAIIAVESVQEHSEVQSVTSSTAEGNN